MRRKVQPFEVLIVRAEPSRDIELGKLLVDDLPLLSAGDRDFFLEGDVFNRDAVPFRSHGRCEDVDFLVRNRSQRSVVSLVYLVGT